MNKNLRRAALLPLVLLSTHLAGCASVKPEGELSGTVGALYNDGMDDLEKGRYPQAVHTFEELQRQYPYSGWATRAEMMSAYASLKNGDEEEAIATADHFIKMHPGHPDLAYVYYLKGIAHYNRMVDVNRDQSNTEEALGAFEEVVNRFPGSIYARDAQMKLTLCRDHLAGKEMVVGRWYQSQNQFLPAINRFKTVVMKYQTTSQTPEALYRLTESYVALGVPEEARRAAAVLGNNFPASPWYNRAYKLLTDANLAPAGQEKSWAKQLAKGLKDIF